jgi:hypothetical protein
MQSMTSADASEAAQTRGGAPLFSVDAAASAGLSADELSRYQHDGWLGVYPLLTPEGVAYTCQVRERVVRGFMAPDWLARSRDAKDLELRPWFKSMHAYVPTFYDITCHPAIVDRMVSILGPDVIAWGATLLRAVPGKTHRWHVDVEHRHWDGVSVFLGLENIEPRSTLKVISGSHHMPEPPLAYGVTDDDSQALAAVRSQVPVSEIVPVPVKPGEFFIFAGRMWHGSHNSATLPRIAMIIHYSRPDAHIRVPTDWNEPINWHPARPPCVLVAGEDRAGVNRLVARPAGGRQA